MKILIAEDDLISRKLLFKILSPFGECSQSENGKQAVDAFSDAIEEGNPFDLVCLDIMMPEMDGQEALKLIRQKEKEINVTRDSESTVIMTTALDTPKDVIEAYYRGGCTSYLVKPINKRKLLDILRELGLIKEA